ncbi:hypothetical protein T492DRAFT_901597 [Pavlovales sp. CCMP2436]|nr:hypothetical protein T492DRAFT_901597 [Pavlovales sp. CCMP2436]
MRWRPTVQQKRTLEKVFATCRSPLPETLESLGASLGVTTKQVRIYFQNRRLRRKETAAPIAKLTVLSLPTSSPSSFLSFAQQLVPMSTPPHALSAKVLGFIRPVLGHLSIRPSATASYTSGGPLTTQAMIIKQSSCSPASNPRFGFTLTEAQHAQHIDIGAGEISPLFSSTRFDLADRSIPMFARSPTLGPASTSASAVERASWAHSGLVPSVAQPLLHRHSLFRHASGSPLSFSTGVESLAGAQPPATDRPAFKPTLTPAAAIAAAAVAAPPAPALIGHNYNSYFEFQSSCSQLLGGEHAALSPAHIAALPMTRSTPSEQLLMQIAHEIDVNGPDVEDMFAICCGDAAPS